MRFLTKPFLNFSIQSKFIIIMMLITFLTLLIACLSFAAYDIKSFRNSTVKELELVGDIIGKRLAPIISFTRDHEKAQDIISDFSSKESVVLSCVYLTNYQVLVYYNPTNKLSCPSKPPAKGYNFTSEYVSIHQNIYSLDKTNIGSIYIQSDLRELRKHFIELLLAMLLVMVIAMLIAYLLARTIEKILIKPIQNLAKTAKAVKDNDDYSIRAIHYYNDELGLLADIFNDMMHEIEKSHEFLEIKVKERTRQLEITNQELSAQKIKAEAANKAKSDFLKNMSHEFRTPLHGIMSFASYGINEYKTSKREDILVFFERIMQCNERLLRLVENILLLATIENGTEMFNCKESNLEDTMEISLKELEFLLADKHIEVKKTISSKSNKAVFDNDKLTQVFTNLIGNAIKFSKQNKTIFIKFDDAVITSENIVSPAIKVTIDDQGVGVPEGESAAIFEKFVQSSRTDKGAGGTGLGLSIVKQIIEAHSGKITVENNQYGGASFAFIIPRNLPEGKLAVKIF